MGITICEKDFDTEDPNKKGYSMHEVDYFAWIPVDFRKTTPNHRMSLRKNLTTGKWEIYRFMWTNPSTTITSNIIIETVGFKGYETVIYSGDTLSEAMSYAYGEYIKYHGSREPDEICTHGKSNNDWMCRYQN